MSLGAYESEVGRGSVLNALAHPSVANPVAAITSGINAARNITDLKSAQFNLQQAQLAPTYQAMRMLAATNSDPSYADVTAALGGAARLNGNIDGVTQNLADWTARGGKVNDFVRAYALGGMSPENQATAGGQQPVTVETGAGTVFGTRGGILSGAPGQFTPGSFVQHGLTPGQATEFVTVTGADGRQYQVPRGTLFDQGGAGGGGGGGGGNATPAGPPPGSNIQPGTTLSQKDADLAAFAQRESGNQNILSRVPVPQGYTQAQGGSGYYQIIPSTWAEGQQLAGIPPAQRTQIAMQASPQQQYQVAAALYDKYGGKPWAQSAPQGQGGAGAVAQPGGGGGGPFIGATTAQPAGGGQGGGGGVRSFDATGQPVGTGGGGAALPGVVRAPGGAPILTPPAPWMGPIWEQSAKEYSNDVSREAGLGSRIQPWQSALSIINANPDLKTGPTSQQWNNWATTLSQWGVQLPSMPGNSVAAYQELSKALHQGLVNSGAFSGTDMARIEAEASSPNMQQKVEAIRELSARQIGYERFQMARLKQFQSLHPGEDPDQYANQYRKETSNWAANLDPVAFGADNLTPEEITAYRKGLSPQQDDKFLRSLKEANRLYPEITPGGR